MHQQDRQSADASVCAAGTLAVSALSPVTPGWRPVPGCPLGNRWVRSRTRTTEALTGEWFIPRRGAVAASRRVPMAGDHRTLQARWAGRGNGPVPAAPVASRCRVRRPRGSMCTGRRGLAAFRRFPARRLFGQKLLGELPVHLIRVAPGAGCAVPGPSRWEKAGRRRVLPCTDHWSFVPLTGPARGHDRTADPSTQRLNVWRLQPGSTTYSAARR